MVSFHFACGVLSEVGDVFVGDVAVVKGDWQCTGAVVGWGCRVGWREIQTIREVGL